MYTPSDDAVILMIYFLALMAMFGIVGLLYEMAVFIFVDRPYKKKFEEQRRLMRYTV